MQRYHWSICTSGIFSCFAISRFAKKMHDHISYAIFDTNWNISEDIFQRICAYWLHTNPLVHWKTCMATWKLLEGQVSKGHQNRHFLFSIWSLGNSEGQHGLQNTDFHLDWDLLFVLWTHYRYKEQVDDIWLIMAMSSHYQKSQSIILQRWKRSGWWFVKRVWQNSSALKRKRDQGLCQHVP